MVGFRHTTRAIVMAAAMLAPVGLLVAPSPAHASIRDTVNDLLDQFAQLTHPDAVAPAEFGITHPPAAVKPAEESAFQSVLPELNMPSLPSVAVAELPEPSVETPFKRLFCAEYARARSGLAMFGDAKDWWSRAKNLYSRATTPVENAVLVFKVTSRLKLGHVAVVTRIVSKREIRVDQANWQNHGEIDHSTPVMDVSAKNDWSQVRVWDMKSSQFGRVYPVSGFIFEAQQQLMRQASNEE
jgi:hypothetical protein